MNIRYHKYRTIITLWFLRVFPLPVCYSFNFELYMKMTHVLSCSCFIANVEEGPWFLSYISCTVINWLTCIKNKIAVWYWFLGPDRTIHWSVIEYIRNAVLQIVYKYSYTLAVTGQLLIVHTYVYHDEK